MTAEAFTIGLDDFLSNGAKAYFKKFGRLPPRDLVVTNTTTLSGAPSLETLLTAVRDSKLANFVIYAHGQSDGSGLFIRLASRKGAATGVSATREKIDLLNRLAAGEKAPSERELGALGIEAAEAARLIKLVRDIKAKKVNTVEFRGCNLGRNPASVAEFKKLFSAKSLGAPDLYSFFGAPPVYTGKTWLAEHRAKRPKGDWHEFAYSFAEPAGTLIQAVARNSDYKPRAGYIVADSAATVKRWVTGYIDAKGGFDGEKELPVHGIWDTGKKKIDPKEIEQIPIGGDLPASDPVLIMPIGNSDYAGHIVYS